MYTQYQQQYAAQNPYTMAQQNMSHMQQQTTFQPSATVTQGAAVVTPSKATTTTDEDVAQVCIFLSFLFWLVWCFLLVSV